MFSPKFFVPVCEMLAGEKLEILSEFQIFKAFLLFPDKFNNLVHLLRIVDGV